MALERQLARGMFWLGSASFVSKILDAVSTFLVLAFLSEAEIGVATLAWSVTLFVESFNGLGMNASVIQRRDLSEEQLASAHWYVVATSVLAAALTVLIGPWLAAHYGAPELSLMVQVSASKILFVGFANVPLALLSKSLNFRALGGILSLATLLSAGLTIALAAAGAGAWAPVLGNTAHGLFQLIGVAFVAPFLPRPRLAWSRIRPLVAEGLRVSGAGSLWQLTRNLDYFIVGQLGGLGALGGYRVAFELAMAPSFAILQVVNRAALPVYSRLAGDRAALTQAVGWSARSAMLLIMTPLFFVAFEGEALFALLGKAPDAATSTTLAVLCMAAVLRTFTQAFPIVYVATGHAKRSLLESLSLAVLLGIGLVSSWTFLASWPTTVRVAAAWLFAYAVLQPIEIALARAVLPEGFRTILRALRGPLLVALLVGTFAGLLATYSPLTRPVLRVVVHGASIVVGFAVCMRLLLNVRPSALLAGTRRGAVGPTEKPSR